MIQSLLPTEWEACGAPRRSMGELRVEEDGGARRALPLASVALRARVAGRIAEVVCEQVFENPSTALLEAVYIFPLGGAAAAVTGFELHVAGRRLEGRVLERQVARQTYEDALDRGHRAALMEHERDDVFTVSVGNLPPGERVTVKVTYAEMLPFFADGDTELRLPLVVGIRYTPGAPIDDGANGLGTTLDTDVVPDASRVSPPRLAPGFDPRTDLTIEVELEPGPEGLQDLRASQHATRAGLAGAAVKVALARQDELLDRDFVLRFRLAGERLETSCASFRGADGTRYGCLTVVPPRAEAALARAARDVVFVVDRSGSMGGPKMRSAARACGILLRTLTPRDRFAILAFDDDQEWVDATAAEERGRRFAAATESAIERGERALRAIDARGGTEMLAALEVALAGFEAGAGLGSSGAPGGARAERVVVFVTDGQVSDEKRVVALAKRAAKAGGLRLFAVGIDTAVNASFLRDLARAGGGTSALAEPGADLDDALRSIAQEIGAPLVTGLTIADDGAGLDAASLTPAALPDVFAGRPAVVFFTHAREGAVRVEGRLAGGGALAERVEARDLALPAIAKLFARSRIADLEDALAASAGRPSAARASDLVALSMRHGVLCSKTSFVVVDTAEVVAGAGEGRETVVQPVHVPALWEQGIAQAPAALPGGALPFAAGGGRSVILGAVAGAADALSSGFKSMAKRKTRVLADEPDAEGGPPAARLTLAFGAPPPDEVAMPRSVPPAAPTKRGRKQARGGGPGAPPPPPPPPPSAPRLVVTLRFPDGTERRFPLADGGALTIGAAADNDLVLALAGVAAHHARIEVRGGALFLTDLFAGEGTFVNGERVAQRELTTGDVIRFGGAVALTVAVAVA